MSKKKPPVPSKSSHETAGTIVVEPPDAKPEFSSRTVVICLLLAVGTLAVYWPVTGFQFINYDDHDYVTENYHVLSGLTWRGVVWAFSSGQTGNWHPLTWLSHMLDCQLFGIQAGRHHLVNLLFHTANTLLLFLTLKKLTGALWRATFVAALFALHPLHVESVVWVSERKDVLSTFFGFLSLLFYVRYVQKPETGSRKPDVRIWSSDLRPLTSGLFWLSLFFFACGLMSKPMLVTWPLVMLLLDYWPLKRISNFEFRIANWKSLLIEKIPFFALSVISSVVTFFVQRAGGAVQSMTKFPLPARVENALVSYARYLGKTFWPVDLANPYPHPGAWLLGWVLAAAVLVAGLCVAAILLRRTRPWVFVGWFWFFGMLVPVIGLVQVGIQSMADRYTYVPLVGIFIILAWGAGEMMARGPVWKIAFGGAGILILAACAWRTADQLHYWRDSGSLSSHAIAVTKDNDVAYSNLGNYFLEKGRLDEAMANYRKALQCARGSNAVRVDIEPATAGVAQTNQVSAGEGTAFFEIDPNRMAACAEVLNNLGTVLAKKGRVDEAMRYYRTVLTIKPNHALALYNLAHELADRKQYDDAIKFYEAAVKSKPDQVEMRDILGNTLMEVGRTDEAIQQYREALRTAPNDAKTLNYLGLALAAQGKTAEAILQYEAALRADPKLIEVHNNLGSAFVNAGNLDAGIRQFQRLLQFMPTHPRAQDNLGVALAMKGNLDEAVAHFREALRLDPTNANTHFNLGNALALQHRFAEAEREYKAALQINPAHAQAHCQLGGVLVQQGCRDEAIAHFREAIRLNPDYEQAKEQLRGLGEAVP